MDQSDHGRCNTCDTPFIISPRQSQISVLTGAPWRGRGWGKWEWYYNHWLAALSERFLVITSLRSCLLLFVARSFCPLLLRGAGGTSSHTRLLICLQESRGDWSEGLEEAHEAQMIVWMDLSCREFVTVHIQYFFQSWHSYYRARFLPKDQYEWFCWLRISFTQCWTAL